MTHPPIRIFKEELMGDHQSPPHSPVIKAELVSAYRVLARKGKMALDPQSELSSRREGRYWEGGHQAQVCHSAWATAM